MPGKRAHANWSVVARVSAANEMSVGQCNGDGHGENAVPGWFLLVFFREWGEWREGGGRLQFV